MSEWQRPDHGSHDEVPTFEVPLDGDAASSPVTTDPERWSPDRRKLVGRSAVAGVVAGVVVAVVVVMTGGEDAEPPPTSLDPEELSSAITVPPTLTPVTEPSPVPGTDGPDADGPDDVSDLALVAASVDTLPPSTVAGIPVEGIPADWFRLSDGSLAALDAALPRRSVTDYVVGVDGFEQTITITNDPTSGRYLLEFDFGGVVEPVIVDLVGGLTYVQPDNTGDGASEWVTIPNEEVAANTGAPDMATFLRNLQLGPIRSDTRDAWELTNVNGLVATPDGGEQLAEHVIVLDAGAVPEWARYAFGPAREAAPLPSNTKIGFAVYVDEEGSIRRVSGASEFGATSQRFVHHIETFDEVPVIDLPLIELPVIEPPVTEPVPVTTAPAG